MIKRYAPYGILFAIVVSVLWTLGLRWDLSKSEWAAWVQAIGSISAVLAALSIVQFQHIKESQRVAEASRLERRKRLNAINSIFMEIARITQKCVDGVRGEKKVWWLEAEHLDEAKRLLNSIPIFDMPDHALVLRFAELTESLHVANVAVRSLNTPRSVDIHKAVGEIVHRTTTLSKRGIAETTLLLRDCGTEAEINGDLESYERQEQQAKLVDQVLNEMQMGATPSPAKHNSSAK